MMKDYTIDDHSIVLFVTRVERRMIDPLALNGLNPRFFFWEKDILNNFRTFLAFIRELVKNRGASIITDSGTKLGFFCWVGGVVLRRQIILRNRGDIVRECEIMERPIRLWFYRKIFIPRLAGIITISVYLKNQLLRQFSALEEKKILVVHSPAPQNIVKFSDAGMKRNWLLFVTNFHFPEKVETFYKISRPLESLLEENRDLEVIVLGEGAEKRSIVELYRRMCNSDRIHFKGHVEDPSWYYRRAFCLIHVSNLDAYPFVVQEARSWGLPVICSRNVGMEEMVSPGADGFFLNDDYKNLPVIFRQLKNPEKYSRIVCGGYKRLERFNSPELIGARFKEALGFLLLS